MTVKAGNSAIQGWTVRWTFANGQTISQMWGATQTSSGGQVTAVPESYNRNLAANATATFGFLASQSGTNPIPTLTCTAA